MLKAMAPIRLSTTYSESKARMQARSTGIYEVRATARKLTSSKCSNSIKRFNLLRVICSIHLRATLQARMVTRLLIWCFTPKIKAVVASATAINK